MFKFPETIKIVGWSYSSQVILLCLALFQVKLLTGIFSLEQYGSWNQITVTVSLMTLLLAFNLGHGFIRLASSATIDEKTRYLYTVIAAQFFTCLAAFIVFWPHRGGLVKLLTDSGSSALFYLITLAIWVGLLNTQLKNFLIVTNRPLRMAQVNVVNVTLNASFICLFAWMGKSVLFAVFGSLLAQLSITIILVSVARPSLRMLGIDFAFLKRTLSFSLPLIVVSVSYWAINSSNRYFIDYFMGKESVAQFSVATRLPSMIILIFTLMSSIFLSKISRMYEAERFSDLSNWMNVTIKIYLWLAIVGAVGLTSASRGLTLLVSNEKYLFDEISLVYLICALTSLFYGVFQIHSRLYELEKRVFRNGLNWSFACILSVLLNCLLIPKFGILGAALAVLGGYGGAFLLSLRHRFEFITWSIKPIRFFVFSAIMLSVAYVYSDIYSSQIGLWTGFLLSGLLASLTAVLGYALGLVQRDDLMWVWNRKKAG
jgi:O-antigen/teichoic acid export membrane protein